MVHMNVMGEAWRPLSSMVMVGIHLPLSFPPNFIVQLLTMVMKHDNIRRTDTLASSRQTQPKVLYIFPTLMDSISTITLNADVFLHLVTISRHDTPSA